MNQPKKSSGGKCLLYGCLTVILLIVIGLLTLYFGGRYVLNKAVESYTSATPATLPKSEITDAQYSDFLNRLTNFSQSLTQSASGVAVTLTLSADEVNAWMQRESGSGSNPRAFVELDGDQIKGQISLPLDEVGWEKLKGRYLNGTGGFKVTFTNSTLDVRLQSLSIGGNPVPASAITQLQTENLAKDFNRGPNKPPWWDLLESVEIKDSKLVIKAKPPEKQPDTVKPAVPKE